MKVDGNLLEKCIAGEEKAERALFEACFPFLMRTCMLYSRDRQEAMGYLNQGFYKILKGLKKKKKKIPFPVWAKRVVINSIIDDYRKYGKNKDIEQLVAEPVTYESKSRNFDQNLADLLFETGDIIAMIKRLSKMTSMVFLLYAVDEYSYREISSKLGMAESTVRWHVSKARSDLIDMMEKKAKSKKVIYE